MDHHLPYAPKGATLKPTDPFTREDYPETITGSGAAKLAASQVAPIVASARAYASCENTDLAELVSRTASAGKTQARKKQIATTIENGAMVMPWYAAKSVGNAGENYAIESSLQLRPNTPIVTPDGKVKKYDNILGMNTVVDVHPSTPPEWLNDPTIPVIFTEGIIKADSALTANLLDSNFRPSDLYTPHGDKERARIDSLIHLRSMLRSLPYARRIIILASVGVSNWERSSWSNITLKDRKLAIAFDGDLARNVNVWREASKLWHFVESAGARTFMLDLRDDDSPKSQLGLDDYFGSPRYWRFDAVRARSRDTMPPPPLQEQEMKKGQWRIAPDGCSLQECIEIPSDKDGDLPTLAWAPRLGYGARVKTIYRIAAPTPEELARGTFDPDALTTLAPEDTYVELEFKWLNDDGDVRVALVSGNATMFENLPGTWTRYCKALIPTDLSRHPEWPPRTKIAENFLAALKQYAPDMVEQAVHWKSMGWVPGEHGPVFIAGNETIPVDSRDGAVRSEVDRAHLSEYGLPEPGFSLDAHEGTDSFIEMITMVLDLFQGRLPGINPDNQPIVRKEYGAILLCAAIRPLVPLKSSCALYLWGPPQRGKSFVASAVMSGFAAYPGAFHTLPGSAADSLPATERLLSQMPIWCIDDIAPQRSKTASDRLEEKIAEIIRASHNGGSRNVMDSSDFGGFSIRKPASPRAVLLLTGEMEPTISSIGQRSILLGMDGSQIGQRSHPAHDPLEPFRTHVIERDNLLARFNRVLLECFIASIREHGWRHYQELFAQEKERFISEFIENIGMVDTRRAAENAADFALSTILLRCAITYFHLPTHQYEQLNARIDEIVEAMCALTARSHASHQETNVGTNLLEAICALLRTGEAYIADPDNPTSAPLHSEGSALSNQMLGWPGESPKNGATQIGYLWSKESHEEKDSIILFSPADAFRLAQKKLPDLVPPGTSITSAWTSCWTLGLPLEGKWKRLKTQDGQTKHFVQVMMPNRTRISCVPFALATILGIGEDSQ